MLVTPVYGESMLTMTNNQQISFLIYTFSHQLPRQFWQMSDHEEQKDREDRAQVLKKITPRGSKKTQETNLIINPLSRDPLAESFRMIVSI